MAKRKNHKLRTALAATLVVASLAAGGWYYRESNLSSASASEPQLQTSIARTGDMTITLSGAGTIVSSSEAEVGFDAGGKVSEVLVQVGDTVAAGDVIARIESTDAEAQVQEAEISLRLAEISLAELSEAANDSEIAAAAAAVAVATENLADLQAGPSADELAAAQATVAAAEEQYQDLLAGPTAEQATSAEATLAKASIALQQAQVDYADVANDTEKSAAASAAYQQALLEYQVAEASYATAMAGATDSELQSAAAQVSQARATLAELQSGTTAGELAEAESQVATAQANLDELRAGASESDLEVAALNVEKAQLTLREAREALAGVELTAPMSGVVTAVDTAVGQTASTGSVITLADMNDVQVKFYVDETDMSLLATGQEVSVVLDALSEETFTGEVLRIEPGLTEVSGVPVVTVWASIDMPEDGSTVSLLADMNATVEVTAADHRGVVLVPVQAVEEGRSGEYTVTVVAADGTLSPRTVAVGLTDDVNYEISSGLQAGETVSIGTSGSTTTSSEAASSSAQSGMPQPDMSLGGGMPPVN
ncbi:MAG: efflux RND transporter periplasmic adaptor subunit [Anaerolineae bacterium]